MKHVAVLGAGGFSGRHFERFAAAQKLGETCRFFGLSRRRESCEDSGLFQYSIGDAREAGVVEAFLDQAQPDYILNLIGVFRADGLDAFMAAHVGVCRAIGEWAARAPRPTQKIVFVGSAAEYGWPGHNPVREDDPKAPVSWYGLSKLYQTELGLYFHRNHGLPVVTARTFNILGEGLSAHLAMGAFARQLDSLPIGGVIKVGNLAPSRDFLDIAQVSAGYWTLLEKGRPGEVYNLCSGEPRSMQSVLDEMIARSGKQVKVEVDPGLLRANDVAVIYGDPSRFRSL